VLADEGVGQADDINDRGALHSADGSSRGGKHPTSNIEHPMAAQFAVHWMFDVGCWMLKDPQRFEWMI
jgi:hypothetical protein